MRERKHIEGKLKFVWGEEIFLKWKEGFKDLLKNPPEITEKKNQWSARCQTRTVFRGRT